ncbi:MAG TPA: T9SS type A sorting domain-containing protein [Chitinophaga sp.]|uniref:Ig-like domain-containing protein n=1 Tax=Chitinophaga sp. TaxID=1869181 RepID=UPI002C63F0A0|nr:T9SS type A sorting domain-containing protein [Chitinophaga sp.]HVI43695.1 T9SS type A sorting domain-containing protein [Chitinophaga sp.]
MIPQFYTLRRITWMILLFLCALFQYTTAQVYANSQTSGVTGLCLLCGVTGADNAVNNASLNDYSTFNISVGLLGVTVYQTLIFPSGSTAGCDSLVIGIGSGNSILSINLVGGLTVQTFNGATPNNDAHAIDSSNLRLWGNSRGEIALKPSATFDRVKITLSSSLVGLLNAFHLYYAYRKPALPLPVVADSVMICAGDTVTVTAAAAAGATVRWYNAPTGGTLLYTGANYKVSPAVTTYYYTDATLNGCTSLRKSTKVIVNPKPANPVYTVPNGISCGNTSIAVSNYTPGIYYKVRSVYSGLFGQLLDTSYNVTGANTVIVPDINYFYNANVSIRIQAVNMLTGCKSDIVQQTLVYGGHATYTAVGNNNITICKGDSTTLYAFVHDDPTDEIANIRWYNAPIGGTLLYTGKYFTVSPSATTSYYATAAYQCEYPVRTRATVNVHKLDDPVFTVPQGMVCGDTKIKVLNYLPGISYRVRLMYSSFTGVLHDTSFTTSNTDTISTAGYIPPIPALVDIYIQARDASTGCRSDTVHQFFNAGGSSQHPSADTDSLAICRGDSVTLHAFVPVFTLSIIRWYDAPSGGNLLYTGNYYKVSPQQATAYYAAAGYECEYPVRTRVKVTVKACFKQAYNQVAPATHILELFPNPSSGEVRLYTDKQLSGNLLTIRNIYGAEVQRSILQGNKFILTPQLTNGIYFIEIRKNAKEVYTGRIVLKR